MRNFKKIAFKVLISVMVSLLWSGNVFAVPESVSVRVTDVTPSSFSVVWMTDVPAEPTVEVFTDMSMTNNITDAVVITPMPGTSQGVADAAELKGVMKVRVSKLSSSTTYYARTVTRDPANVNIVGYSSPVEVTTSSLVVPYTEADDDVLLGTSNDLLSFEVYTRPSEEAILAGGNLVVLEAYGSSYPISAFVGEGGTAPEGIIDLNNLFGINMMSLNIKGGEKLKLRIYRGGTLSTLLHYRVFPADNNSVEVVDAVKGFFADINIDSSVDEADFALFKAQYKTEAEDDNYNPDYNFVEDEAGGVGLNDRVDVRDFSRFSREYGRVGVE